MSQFFRASVGAVIMNSEGRVLALERSDTEGSWQFPQGGIDDHEEPLAAAFREVREETGIAPDSLLLIRQHPHLLSYELPREWRSPKVGRGQTQRWFLFRFLLPDNLITLPSPGEFRLWRWLDFHELMPLVAAFRQELYRAIAREFTEITLGSPTRSAITPHGAGGGDDGDGGHDETPGSSPVSRPRS
jgi:putative (di)nucleoside polyphosphate hydrolase